MKRFDKGYIYSNLLTDFIYSVAVVFIFLKDLFLGEESNPENIAAATPFLVGGFTIIYLCFVVYRILYYRASGYELTDKEIKCSRGVLFRKTTQQTVMSATERTKGRSIIIINSPVGMENAV